jgi:hypothetical protein
LDWLDWDDRFAAGTLESPQLFRGTGKANRGEIDSAGMLGTYE